MGFDLHPGLSVTSTTSLIRVMYMTMETDRRKKVDWLSKQAGTSPFLCTVLNKGQIANKKKVEKAALEILTASRLNNTKSFVHVSPIAGHQQIRIPRNMHGHTFPLVHML